MAGALVKTEEKTEDMESKSELKKVTAEKDRLLKKVGQLTIDCDFFAKACEDAGLKVRCSMILFSVPG